MAKQVNLTEELKISLTQLKNEHESGYEKRIIDEIIKATNALRNGSGGTLTLRYSPPMRGDVKISRRTLEQKMQNFLTKTALAFDIKIADIPASSPGYGGVKITVKTSTKSNKYTTLRYHMYLPSEQQVNEISPTEHVDTITMILMKSLPLEEATKRGSHYKCFIKDESVPFSESKTTQFKMLEDKKAKTTSLADRIVGKGNKFPSYVSAFANYAGGHIYFGIKDDGKVQGEHVNQEEKKKVKEMICKEMEKMLWPMNCESEDGNEDNLSDNRWAVFFEPVKDTEKKEIPSLYVVVVFVAQCPGGVFTEAPECYEIVESKVQKMNFNKWKANIDPSFANKETCCANGPDVVYDMLTNILNKRCDRKELDAASVKAQIEHKDSVEVRLICLSNLISYYLRIGKYQKADELLEKFHRICITLPKASNTLLRFHVMENYLLSTKERCKGNYDGSYDIAKHCIDDLQHLPPCIISAAFYIQIGTLQNILAIKRENRSERLGLLSQAEENYDIADSHLDSMQGHSTTKAEFKQKIYINKCMLQLRSSLTGEMLPNPIAQKYVKQGRENLKKMQQIILDGYPLHDFRRIQNLFALSCLSYRLCMSDPSRQKQLLRDAIMYSEEAKSLAEKWVFVEMTRYSKNYIDFFTSEQAKCKS